MSKKQIQTDKAPKAIGPYSQGIDTGSLVFVSGQIPINPATGSIVSEDVGEQAHQVMKNLLGVLETAGLGAAHIVKTTILLKNLEHFSIVNGIYGSYLSEPYPARATYQVAALPMNVLIEIEAIAARS